MFIINIIVLNQFKNCRSLLNMYLFTAELIDVQNGEFNSLVFKSKKFDYGLNEEVPCSVSIGISKDCEIYIPNYKKHIGERVLIGVEPRITKNKSSIFSFVKTDILDVAKLFTSEIH